MVLEEVNFSQIITAFLLSTKWVDYVEEPMKYQALRPHFFSVGGWRWWDGGWWGGWWWGGGVRVGGGGMGVVGWVGGGEVGVVGLVVVEWGGEWWRGGGWCD